MEKEYDKKYTWAIKNFSSSQSERMHSSPFVAGGCIWCLMAFPKRNNGPSCLSLYLSVVNSAFLPFGWTRHVKFRLTIVNQLQKKLSVTKEAQELFEKENNSWIFDSLLPLTELHAKDGGFLVNGELIVVAEIKFLQVIGKSDVTEETSPILMESVDVNGFNVYPVSLSQVESVKRLFDIHPDFASNFRPENPFLKTAYMSLLFGVIKTLSQSSQKISKKDLGDASTAVISLKVAGFNLDWLEKKIDEINEVKERAAAVESRMHEIDEKLKELKELEVLLEKEKEDILAKSASLLDEKVDDVSDFGCNYC